MDWNKIERSAHKLASNLYGLVSFASIMYILIFGTNRIRVAILIAVASFLACSALDPDIQEENKEEDP